LLGCLGSCMAPKWRGPRRGRVEDPVAGLTVLAHRTTLDRGCSPEPGWPQASRCVDTGPLSAAGCPLLLRLLLSFNISTGLDWQAVFSLWLGLQPPEVCGTARYSLDLQRESSRGGARGIVAIAQTGGIRSFLGSPWLHLLLGLKGSAMPYLVGRASRGLKGTRTPWVGLVMAHWHPHPCASTHLLPWQAGRSGEVLSHHSAPVFAVVADSPPSCLRLLASAAPARLIFLLDGLTPGQVCSGNFRFQNLQRGCR
jgi:hypothetical protein